MTFKSATGQTIDEAFQKFHDQHPEVYRYFKVYVNEILATGKKVTSSKMIINRIRWELYLDTKRKEEFKINDAFSSRYSRLYAEEFPKFKDIFHYRDLRS